MLRLVGREERRRLGGRAAGSSLDPGLFDVFPARRRYRLALGFRDRSRARELRRRRRLVLALTGDRDPINCGVSSNSWNSRGNNHFGRGLPCSLRATISRAAL
jgi:hypothetical protein